jgi:hypothetical protein
MLGVVYDVVPVPPVRTVPPVAAAYQSTVSPAATLADIVTVPVPHLELPAGVGTLGIEFTVAVTGVLDADTQPVVVFLVCA